MNLSWPYLIVMVSADTIQSVRNAILPKYLSNKKLQRCTVDGIIEAWTSKQLLETFQQENFGHISSSSSV